MRYIALLLLFVAATNAQEKYKLCATDKITDSACQVLQRGGSRVSCLRVTDNAECAIRLSTGEADFGVFDAEDLMLIYKFYPNEIVPIFQQKHVDRKHEDFQFQSVAVVSANVTPTEHAIDFKSIKDGGLCHPGFSDSQWWNDYILKYFERKVASAECQPDLTIAENEAQNIKNFFGTACRPGEWATQSSFDKSLKERYPELCALCDDPATCTYKNQASHGHIGALDCLTSGRGKVAYVALKYVHDYFKANDTYKFLCTDGTTQPLSMENPCAWIKQPWGVIAARKSIATELTNSLKEWLIAPYSSEAWTISLNKILQEDSVAIALTDNTSMVAYISKGREVDLPNAQSCKTKPMRWCTIGDLETNKCMWLARGAEALGIEPKITCENSSSTFHCFRKIANDKADLMTIDSNYGHLARTVYGLSTILYSETESDKNSIVLAVTPEKSENPIKSFGDLSNRRACFPEYGGIAWLSFVHVARMNEIISPTSCEYPKLVGSLFSGACTPGILDNDHSIGTLDEHQQENSNTLCSICPSNTNSSFCAANEGNIYYGDRGALRCLQNGDGDIAFIETRNLKDSSIDPMKYRVLCKNGSLASYPGFNVDEFCAWSVTIDSEIVGRKNSSEVDVLDTTLALLKMENWLGYNVHAHRSIRIYDKFNCTADLLFKDSTSGLVDSSSTLQAVVAYKEIFEHVETCSAAPLSVAANLSLTALVVLSTIFFSRI